MNKTRYFETEFGRNKPMNFRPSGTLTANGPFLQTLAAEIDIYAMSEWGGGLGDRQGGGGGRGEKPPATGIL